MAEEAAITAAVADTFTLWWWTLSSAPTAVLVTAVARPSMPQGVITSVIAEVRRHGVEVARIVIDVNFDERVISLDRLLLLGADQAHASRPALRDSNRLTWRNPTLCVWLKG